MHTRHLSRSLAAALLIGGLATGGAALAADTSSGQRTTTQPRTAEAETPTSTTQEQGLVIEAAGSAHGVDVQVYLYENQRYGNSLQVVLDPEADLIGWTEQAEPFVADGQVDVAVEIDGLPARLTGTVAGTDVTTKVVEPGQDGGEQRVVRGTHTQLDADLSLAYDGVTVPLEEAPAFAFDLEVRSTTLYGR